MAEKKYIVANIKSCRNNNFLDANEVKVSMFEGLVIETGQRKEKMQSKIVYVMPKVSDQRSEKMQSKILAFMSKIPIVRKVVIGRASMKMIVFICIVYCCLLSLFVYGWCWQWKYRGILDLEMLLSGIREMSAPAVLAALQFFIGSLHDSNGNGVPDTLEKEDIKK